MYKLDNNKFKLPTQEEQTHIPTEDGVAAISLAYRKELEEVRRKGVMATVTAEEQSKLNEITQRNNERFQDGMTTANSQAVSEAIEAQRQADKEAKRQAMVDSILSYSDNNPSLRQALESNLDLSEQWAEGDLYVRDRREMSNIVAGQAFLEQMKANADHWLADLADVEVLVGEFTGLFTKDFSTEDFVKMNSKARKELSTNEYIKWLSVAAKKMDDQILGDNIDTTISEFEKAISSTIEEAERDDITDLVWAGIDITGLGLITGAGKAVKAGAKRVTRQGSMRDGISSTVRKTIDDLEQKPNVKHRFLDDSGKEIDKETAIIKATEDLANGKKPRVRVQQVTSTPTGRVKDSLSKAPSSQEAQRGFKVSMGAVDDVVDDANRVINNNQSTSTFREEADVVKGMSPNDDLADVLQNSALPLKVREGVKRITGDAKKVLENLPKSGVERAVRDFVKQTAEEGGDFAIKTQEALQEVLAKNNNPTEVAKFKLASDEKGNPAGYVAKVAKGDGRTYTKQEADLLADELSVHYEAKPVLADEGGYLLEVNIPINDLTDVAVKEFDIHRSGMFSRLLLNPTAVIDRSLHTLFRAAEGNMGPLEDFVREATKPLKLMTKKDRKELDSFLQQKLKLGEEKWYKPDDLVFEYEQTMGKQINGDQVTGYYALRSINDFTYEMANKTIREILEFKGYSQWDVMKADGAPLLKGIIAKHTPRTPEKNELVYNSATQSVETTGGRLTPQVIQDLKEQGYGIFRLESSSMRTIREVLGREHANTAYSEISDAVVSHMILPLERTVQKELSTNPLPYVGGPRIMYDAPHVIKQGKVKTMPQEFGGFQQKMRDVAVMSSKIREAGKKGASHLEETRKVLKDLDEGKITQQQADEILSKQDMKGLRGFLDFELPSGSRVALNTASGARRAFDELNLSLDGKFQLVRDGQHTTVGSGSGVANPQMADGEALASVKANSRFQARTNRRLTDVEGEVPFVNIIESTNRSFSKMARFSSFERVKELWANGFMNNYVRNKDYLDIPPNATVSEALEARVKDSVENKIKQEILAQQNFVKQVVGYEKREERLWQLASNRIADSIFKRTDSKAGTWLAKRMAETGDKDITALLKQYTFNVKLGMGRIDNMLQQTMTGVAAMAIAPKYAGRAFKTAFHYQTATWVSKGGKDLKALRAYAKKVRKEVGDQEQFVKEYQDFIAFGGNNYSSNMQEIATTASGRVTSGLGQKISHYGSAAFRQGDRTSRIMTYSIARDEVVDGVARTAKGKVIKDLNSDEAATYIIQRMNDLSLGMSRADVQEIARTSLGGMALQFMSYPMRMMGVFFDRTLTKAEKARLGVFYILSAGAAGVPFATTVLDSFEANHSLDPTTSKIAYNGLIDAFMLEMFGADTDFSSSIGAGLLFDDFLENFQDSNVAELLGGASLSTAVSGADALWNEAVKYSKAGADIDDLLAGTTAAFLRDQIVSINKLQKAYIGWKMGMVADKRGDPQFNISKKEAFLSLLGFRFGKQKELSSLYKMGRSDKEVIQTYRDMFAELHNKRYKAVLKGDEGMKTQIDSMMNQLRMTIEDTENVDVINSVLGNQRRVRPQRQDTLSRKKEEFERIEEEQ